MVRGKGHTVEFGIDNNGRSEYSIWLSSHKQLQQLYTFMLKLLPITLGEL